MWPTNSRRLIVISVIVAAASAPSTAPAQTTQSAKQQQPADQKPKATPTPAATPTAAAGSDNCLRGRRLEDLDRPGEAATAYLKGLGTSKDAACRSGLDGLQSGTELCAEAKALDDAGRTSDANAAYRKVLAQVPSLPCAANGVDDTTSPKVWAWTTQAVKDVGTVVLGLVLAGLILLLAVFCFAWVAARAPVVRSLPLIRALRRPRMTVNALDDSVLEESKLGVSVTALLRARIADSGQSSGRVELAAGEAGSSEALAGIGEVSGQAGALLALVQFIKSAIRTSQWSTSGELHAESSQARGITLSLSRDGRYENFADFWAGTDGGPPSNEMAETYRRLTYPAAGWVRHCIAEARDPDRLITGDARSYALFEAGLAWQEQGEKDAARSFYDRALLLDPRNLGALANLGVLDYEDGNWAEADRRLTQALEVLEG